MFEIFKAFYSVHYNFGAFALLLLLLVIFLLTKKNFKWAIIFFIVDIAFNAFIYHKTAHRVWIITDTPAAQNEWDTPAPKTYRFSAPDNWVIEGENGEKMHWCWVETWTEKFLSFDFVDKLWGTNKAKQLRGASEERLDQ
ncbi:MAG: hypothetical protein K6A31_09175 [Fibrobacter sp.]|jgi:hypothetical protein|nr:hypothetical protein [Fibrobacter sp.]